MSHPKQIVSTPQAPPAMGPYSQGVVGGGLVFTAMQLGLDPATEQLASGGIQAETRRVLENQQAVLEAAGSSLDKAVKVTVYLADLADFGPMNEVYAHFFPADRPARSVVQVAAMPRNARIAVEMIALK